MQPATCTLGQNDRGLLRATAVTRRVERTPNKSQRTKFSRRSGRDLNSQPLDHESGALTNGPSRSLSDHAVTTNVQPSRSCSWVTRSTVSGHTSACYTVLSSCLTPLSVSRQPLLEAIYVSPLSSGQQSQFPLRGFCPVNNSPLVFTCQCVCVSVCVCVSECECVCVCVCV